MNIEAAKTENRIKAAEKRAQFVNDMNIFKQEKIELKRQKDLIYKNYRDQARQKYLENRRRSEAKKMDNMSKIKMRVTSGRERIKAE